MGYFYTSIVRAVFFNQAALRRAELKLSQDSAAMQRRRSSVPGELPEPPTQEEDVSHIFNYFLKDCIGEFAD